MLLVCDFVYLCDVSDDRSADVFKTKLEAATQMKSVLESDPRPNCLVIDEIDGAPQVNVSLKILSKPIKREVHVQLSILVIS